MALILFLRQTPTPIQFFSWLTLNLIFRFFSPRPSSISTNLPPWVWLCVASVLLAFSVICDLP